MPDPQHLYLDTDDFNTYLQEKLKNPEFAEAYRIASEKVARLKERLCSESQCVEYYDPNTGEVDTSVGPVDCLCKGSTE